MTADLLGIYGFGMFVVAMSLWFYLKLRPGKPPEDQTPSYVIAVIAWPLLILLVLALGGGIRMLRFPGPLGVPRPRLEDEEPPRPMIDTTRPYMKHSDALSRED